MPEQTFTTARLASRQKRQNNRKLDVVFAWDGCFKMQTKYLLILLLSLVPVAICGCASRVEGSSSPPAGAAIAPGESVGPVALVPEPERRTRIEVYLGLHSEISAREMEEMVVRIRKEGRFSGQGCGGAPDENGKACGAFWDFFLIKSPEEDKPDGIELGYLQNETGLNTVSGDGFEYRLRQGVFHRKDRPKREQAN